MNYILKACKDLFHERFILLKIQLHIHNGTNSTERFLRCKSLETYFIFKKYICEFRLFFEFDFVIAKSI